MSLKPHPGLDAADAAQRDRQLVDAVVTELLAEGFECLLEPRDDPALTEWEVVRCVAEREPEHGPLQVLGLRDAVDHGGSDGSDASRGSAGAGSGSIDARAVSGNAAASSSACDAK